VYSAPRDGLLVVSWPAQPGGVNKRNPRLGSDADALPTSSGFFDGVVARVSSSPPVEARGLVSGESSDECRPELVLPLVHPTRRTVGLAHVAVTPWRVPVAWSISRA
jgi:hypothetical protein